MYTTDLPRSWKKIGSYSEGHVGVTGWGDNYFYQTTWKTPEGYRYSLAFDPTPHKHTAKFSRGVEHDYHLIRVGSETEVIDAMLW